MAVHINAARMDLGIKWATVDKSERIFNYHVLAAVKAGLLKVGEHADITQKRLDFIKEHVSAIVGHGYDIPMMTDLNRHVGKALFYLTSGIAHSPLREINQASERERLLNFVIETALLIAKHQGYDDVHAYFLTLTVPNCDLGDLESGIKSVADVGSEVLRALKDATKRKNGLRLPGLSGDFVDYLGGLLKTEITVNRHQLEHEDPKKIFHPHVHIILFTSGALDMKLASAKLLDYWRKKHPDTFLTEKAFWLKPCYDKETGGVSVSSAVAEAAKYAVKPDFYSRFPYHPTDFSMRVFAELYHYIKGRQILRVYGIVRAARGWVRFLKKGAKNGKKSGSIFAAALAAGYKNAAPLSGHVPDLYTQVGILNRGKFVESREMDPQELRWANRQLIQNSIWRIPDGIEWPDTAKGRLYAFLFGMLDFIQSPDEFKARLDRWYALREHQLDLALKLGTDGVDKCNTIMAQISDLDALKAALPTDWNNVQAVNMKRIYKVREMYVHMKRLGVRFGLSRGELYPIFSDDEARSSAIEQELCAVFLSDDECDVHFMDSTVCAEYLRWVKTGRLPGLTGEDVQVYSAVCGVTGEEFQRSVDNINGAPKFEKYRKMFVYNW